MIKPRRQGGANRANNQNQRTDYKPKPPRKPNHKQIVASLSLYAASKRQGGAEMTDYDFVSIDGLLSRLDGVKRTAPGKWIAKSPTRKERTASLSIRLTDDGRVLLHDFGGDEAADILAALGLNWVQLIPPHLRNNKTTTPAERQGHDAMAALNSIQTAAIVVRICANKLADGYMLNKTDRDHLRKSAHDIDRALSGTRGVRHV